MMFIILQQFKYKLILGLYLTFSRIEYIITIQIKGIIMLSLFKIRNFKSILDMTIDFRYKEGKAPNNWQEMPRRPFLEINKDNRFVPVMALYGANASGKTNVIEALKELHDLLTNRIDLEKAFHPNKLNKKYDTTTFEIEFFVDNEKFNYALEYDEKHIISEELLKNDKVVYNIALPDIFDMSGLEIGSYETGVFREFFDIELSTKRETDKQTQIKTFFGTAPKKFPGIVDLAKIKLFLDSLLVIRSTNFAENGGNYMDFIPLEVITEFVKKFDIDIDKIIKEDSGKKNTLASLLSNKDINYPVIKTIHKDINNKDVILDMATEESLGTNLLFGIAELLLLTLKNGSVLVIDELDRSLHPFLLTKIIELFKDKDYNVHNAQLLFTCHSTDILENQTLRVSEVAIVTKNLKDGSTIRKLSDFEGLNLRNTYDFRRMYLSGNFGGVPFPYI